MGSRARVISDPDTEVLDLQGVLLVDLYEISALSKSNAPHMYTYHLDADDLTGGLLDLLETSQEVPVSGLGDRRVGSEDGHSVEGGGGVSLRGQMTADDLEFLKTTWRMGVSTNFPGCVRILDAARWESNSGVE